MGLDPRRISPSQRLLRDIMIPTLLIFSNHLHLHSLKTALQAKYFNYKLCDTLQTERRVEKGGGELRERQRKTTILTLSV